MLVKAKLSDIIEAIEFQSDERTAYLDKKTGEVVIISDEEFNAAEDDKPLEDYPEWQRDLIKAAHDILEHEEDFLCLPTKYYVHEYEIMEGFCLSIRDERISDALYNSIKGRGAFRRSKDGIHRHGIEDDWYAYRDKALKQIAVEWCEEHDIQLKDE